MRSGSTFDAHRIVHLAGAHGMQDAIKERLLRAHFTDGELVSDHDTLLRIAVEAGLPEQEVREVLAGEHLAEAVREDERLAADLGVSAVPTFVVDRSVGVSGAHAPDALLGLLEQGWARRVASQPPAAGEGRPHGR